MSDSNEKLHVLNRGVVVGTVSQLISEMSHLAGTFLAANTPCARRFVTAATALDARAVIVDPSKGILTSLRESAADTGTTFVVISLADGRWYGRRVLDRRQVEWAKAKVPS